MLDASESYCFPINTRMASKWLLRIRNKGQWRVWNYVIILPMDFNYILHYHLYFFDET